MADRWPKAATIDGEVVEALIGAGADVDARDHRGRTPLHRAATAKYGDGTALTTLLAAGMVPFAISVEFAHKEHATGYLTPAGGWSQVSARHPATVP